MLRKIGVGLALVGCGVFLQSNFMSAEAATITGCVTASGNLTISSTGTCPKKTSVLTWDSAGPTGPAGPGAVLVYDANNQALGPLIYGQYADSYRVMLTAGADQVFPSINLSGFSEAPSQQFLFWHTSGDCSGPRYLYGELVSTTYSLISGNVLYYPAKPFQTPLIGSVEMFGPGADVSLPGNCQTYTTPVPSNIPMGLAGTLDLSTLPFVPPFSVR